MPLNDKPPQVPPPGTVLIDAQGRLTKQGYDFLVALVRYLEKLRVAVP